MADTLSDEQIDDLKEAFGVFEYNKDGMIDCDDLPALLRSLGQNPKEEETIQLSKEIDAEGTGSIDFPEFLALIARKQKEALQNEAELHEAFLVFDKNGSGYLIKEEFMQIIKQGDFMSKEEKNRLEEKANEYFKDNEKLPFDIFMSILKEKL